MATAGKLEIVREQPTPMTQCPMTAALRAVGGKWSLIVIYFLDHGVTRFNDIRRSVPDVSHKVLSETLRNLEDEGLIIRTVHSLAPSHVEYRLSEHGESVRPLMESVRTWGRHHLRARSGSTGLANAIEEPTQ